MKKIFFPLLVLFCLAGFVSAEYYNVNIDLNNEFTNYTITGCDHAFWAVSEDKLIALCNVSSLVHPQVVLKTWEISNDNLVANTSVVIPYTKTSYSWSGIGVYEDYVYIYSQYNRILKYDFSGNLIWELNVSPKYNQTVYNWYWDSCNEGHYYTIPEYPKIPPVSGSPSSRYLTADMVVDSDGVNIVYKGWCGGQYRQYSHDGEVISYGFWHQGGWSCTIGKYNPKRFAGVTDDYVVIEVEDDESYLVYRKNQGFYMGGKYKCGSCGVTNPACNQLSANCFHRGESSLVASFASTINASWISGVSTCSGNYSVNLSSGLFLSGVSDSEIFSDYNIYNIDDLSNTDGAGVIGSAQYGNSVYARNKSMIAGYNDDGVILWNFTKYQSGVSLFERSSVTPYYVVDVNTSGNLTILNNSNGNLVSTYQFNQVSNSNFIQPKIIKSGSSDDLVVINNRFAEDVIVYINGVDPLEELPIEENLTYYLYNGLVKDIYTDIGVNNLNLHFCKWCDIEKECIENYYTTTGGGGFYSVYLTGGDYNITIYDPSKRYGITYILHQIVYNTTEDYYVAPFYVNASVFSMYNLNSPLANTTINLRKEGVSYINFTNNSGQSWLWLNDQGVYSYDVYKNGYIRKTGNYSYHHTCNEDFTGLFKCNQLVFYLEPDYNRSLITTIQVRDVLDLTGIANATVIIWELGGSKTCASAHLSPADYFLTTNNSGGGSITLDNGSYRVDIYAEGYFANTVNCKVLSDNDQWRFNMVVDPSQYDVFTINGTTYLNNIPTSLDFELYCTTNFPDGRVIRRDLYSNDSGFYSTNNIYYQSLCHFIYEGTDRGIVEILGDTTYNLYISKGKLYSVYIGNYLTGDRIIGSGLTVYVNGSYYRHDIDNDPDKLLGYYFANNSGVALKAEKYGYSIGWDNFTANESADSVRIIGLVQEGGFCYPVVYYNSNSIIEGNPTVNLIWNLRESDNETLVSSGNQVVTSQSLYDPGTFTDLIATCGECFIFNVEGWANIRKKATQGFSEYYTWDYMKVYDYSAEICTNDVYASYSFTMPLIAGLNFGFNTSTNSSFIVDPSTVSGQAYDAIVGGFSTSSIIGQFMRALLEGLGFDPNMSIIMFAILLSIGVMVSMLIMGNLLILKDGYSKLTK